VVIVTRNEMLAKENMLQKGKRANKITRRTKMVMVTKKTKAHKKMLEKVIRLLMTMVLRFHIIDIIFNLQEEVTLQEEAKDVLMEHTQDSSIQMSSAIQMPSSNALQVVQIWVIVTTSCRVNHVKSINISTFIMSLNL
jgi:hypothetical protein